MPRARNPKRAAFYALGALGALIILGVFAWYLPSLIGAKAPSEKRQVPITIKIIRPPEPPPEPPPPPPEKPQEQIPQDTPEQKPVEQAPQSAQLGVDAEGTAGGDSFGLVGNAGGRDLVGSGNGPFVLLRGHGQGLGDRRAVEFDRARRIKYSVTCACGLPGTERSRGPHWRSPPATQSSTAPSRKP